PKRSLCPVTEMMSYSVPFSSSAKVSSSVLPAGFKVDLSKAKKESAENATLLGLAGAAATTTTRAGSGGGATTATTITVFCGSGAAAAGAGTGAGGGGGGASALVPKR